MKLQSGPNLGPTHPAKRQAPSQCAQLCQAPKQLVSDTNSVALEGLITGSTVGFIAGEAAARQDTFVRPLRGCGGADAGARMRDAGARAASGQESTPLDSSGRRGGAHQEIE